MRGKPVFRSREPNPSGITPADAGKTRSKRTQYRGSRDHPRGCGENSLLMQGSCDDAGSPPRMRGKQASPQSESKSTRITPADAGKTVAAETAHGNKWDHPRGCGENVPRIAKEVAESGSPPRMRGKRREIVHNISPDGITPADAGKTRRNHRDKPTVRDHPRGCGENRARTI